MNSFETEWERPEFDSVPSLAENMVYLLRDCDNTLVRKTLQVTYRDFCKRSAALRTWRKIPLAFDGEREGYVVTPILSGEIDCVTQVVWEDGRAPVRRWSVCGDPPTLRFSHRYSEQGLPRPHVVFEQGREIPLCAENPTCGPWAILVEAVEIPHLNEERAPRSFLQRYGDAIVDGALVRLFSMANRPWSDPEQARQHGVAYANALSEARLRGMAGGPAANAGRGFALDLGGMV